MKEIREFTKEQFKRFRVYRLRDLDGWMTDEEYQFYRCLNVDKMDSCDAEWLRLEVCTELDRTKVDFDTMVANKTRNPNQVRNAINAL